MKIRNLIFLTLCIFLFSSAQCMAASKINWQSYDSAVKKSQRQGKLIYFYFYTDWCGYCKKMDRETFTDPKVIRYINSKFIPVSMNPEKDKIGKKLASAFRVRGFPASGFSEDGTKSMGVAPGYIPPDRFLIMLKYMGSGSYKKMSFEDFSKK